MPEIEKVIPIKISSLNDLVRLAASSSAPPHNVTYLLKYRLSDGRVVIGVMGLYRDYYKYYGIPLFYYYVASGEEAEKIWDSNYILVSTSDEKISFSKTPKPALSIPLIALSEKPLFIPDVS